MKKSILFHLVILLFACNPSGENNTEGTESASEAGNDPIEEKGSNGASIEMKTLFSLSPLSIFDSTTEGISDSEKEELIKKGESATWKIIEENKTKLTIHCKNPSSQVTLRFLKNKDNSDGVLFAAIENEQNTNLLSWKYSDDNKTLQETNILKKYSANDFVSKEDKLPDSYHPVLHYLFIDDQTIEVSLHTWMEKEFENRDIINRIFLKWNGESFDEEIVENKQTKENNKFSVLNKPDYDLSKLEYDGKIVNKKIWQDANGENIALFTRKGNELFVYHYSISADIVKLLRKVYDFERDCDYDLFLEFIENSIGVTDLDENNYGEITFAYKKACISDVSPLDLKLLMLENGNKFIIRGLTVVNTGNEKIGGDKNIDASFEKAPDNFLSHANTIWESVNK